MKIKGQKKRVPGINITVSPKAHAVILKEALSSKPRKTLRAIINSKYNLPEYE